jgi:hypothetical protein
LGITPAVRIGAAFVASLAAAGLVQQASMAAARVREPLEALPPLALLVILLTAILALPAWRRPAAIGLAAGLLLTLLAVIGAGGYCLGLATLCQRPVRLHATRLGGLRGALSCAVAPRRIERE